MDNLFGNHEMKTSSSSRIPLRPGPWLAGILLAGLYSITIAVGVGPELVYHALGQTLPYPKWVLGWDFALETMGHPGGGVDYVNGLLSQGLFNSWTGAGVLTVVAAAMWMGMVLLIRLRKNRMANTWGSVPALVLLVLYSRYGHPLGLILAWLAGVWAGILYQRIETRSIGLRVALYLILSTMVYWIAAGGLWLLVVIAAWDELQKKRPWMAGIDLALGVGIVFGIGVGGCAWPWPSAFGKLLPLGPGWGLIPLNLSQIGIQILWLCPLAAVILTWMGGSIRTSRRRINTAPRNDVPALMPAKKAILSWAWVALAFVSPPLTVWLSRDAGVAGQLKIGLLADQHQWDRLLDSAGRLPVQDYNVYINYDINRALYHSGRLADEMFGFPQSPAGLLLGAQGSPDDPELTDNSELMMELGSLNMAEHSLMETLEVRGDCPRILRLLVWVNLGKELPDTARVFMGALSRIPVYRRQALKWMEELRIDPLMSDDPVVQQLRRQVPQNDMVSSTMGPEDLFDYLLDHNPSNRMAWDYRMVFFLLTKQIDKVAANLEGLQRFGQTRLPRHYAEALAIYLAKGGTNVRLGQLEYPEEFNQKARAFVEHYNRFKGDRALAMKTLAPNYGDSYFFYYMFGTSGIR